MRFRNMRTPVSSPDGNDREFGHNDSSSDSSSDFFGALDTESDVSARKREASAKRPHHDSSEKRWKLLM